jgi:hypothetical protein
MYRRLEVRRNGAKIKRMERNVTDALLITRTGTREAKHCVPWSIIEMGGVAKRQKAQINGASEDWKNTPQVYPYRSELLKPC